MIEQEVEKKQFPNKLTIGVVIFALILIFGLISMKQPEYTYSLDEIKMLEKIQTFEHVVAPDSISGILFDNKSNYQFIDLRSTHDYQAGHLDGAISIPVAHILDEQYQDILNQDKKTNILYYSDHCGACGPWMILEQLGYKNNKLLLGGYDYIEKHIINKQDSLAGSYKNEQAKYDFAKIISNTAGGDSLSVKKKVEKPVLPIKKKKKVMDDSGGC